MRLNWKLIAIVLIAAFLRFYQLGVVPPSLDWDEASLAYNAKAILETGRDEYGNFLPLTIRSFNDYKPPLYTYLLVPALVLMGESDFAVRFPSALAGTLTIVAVYFLTRELFPRKSLKIGIWDLKIEEIVGFLLAISPWHLQFSRVAFEANLALFFFLTGIFLYVKSFSKTKWLSFAALSFGLSLMAYHSTKVILPLFLLFTVWPQGKAWLKDRRVVAIAGVVTVLFIILVGRTIQLGIGQSRLGAVSLLTIDKLFDQSRQRIEANNFSFLSRGLNHRYLVVAKEYLGGYLDHYNFNFWFVQGDSNQRHSAVTQGVLYWWALPFILFGIVKLLREKTMARRIVFTLFFIAPAASALTSGTPNSVRSIFFIPTFEIFTALGTLSAIDWIKHKKPKALYSLFTILYSLLIFANIGLYFELYHRHTPGETSQAWQYGYKQMVEWVEERKELYDRIIVTTSYDQPYIYFLWYGHYSPKTTVNPGDFATGFGRYEFRPVNFSEDINFTKTLLVGTPDEIKDRRRAIFQANFLDGSPAFLAIESI